MKRETVIPGSLGHSDPGSDPWFAVACQSLAESPRSPHFEMLLTAVGEQPREPAAPVSASFRVYVRAVRSGLGAECRASLRSRHFHGEWVGFQTAAAALQLTSEVAVGDQMRSPASSHPVFRDCRGQSQTTCRRDDNGRQGP